MAKVKELFAFREKQNKPNSYITTDLIIEKPLMHRLETIATKTDKSDDDDLFYSLTSFLQALNLGMSDLEGFTDIPNDLVSLSLKGYTNLLFLNLSSPENLVRFQRSDSFNFIKKVSPQPNFFLLISSNFCGFS